MLLTQATPSVTVSVSTSGNPAWSLQQPTRRWEEGGGVEAELCWPHKQPC